MVNGEPITDYDIEQRSKLIFISTHKQADRKDVLKELIDEKIKIREGKKYGVDPSGSDIDQAYGALGTYVTRHALAVEGAIREYYVVGPSDTPDDRLWRTEVGWPIFQTG